MADLVSRLHDLIDAREARAQRAREHARTVLARVDLPRLLDPADEEYDAGLRDELLGEMVDAGTDVYGEGRDTAAALGSRRRVDRVAPNASVLLVGSVALTAARVQRVVADFGQRADARAADAMARGMSPEIFVEVMQADLDALGPRMFGPLAGALDAEAELAVGGAIQAGLFDETALQGDPSLTGTDLAEAAFNVPMVWVCALVNTCHDCLPRHGEVRGLAEWALDGLPGTGWSVCGAWCQCQLVDADVASSGELREPLMRVRVRVEMQGRGLTVRAPAALFRAAPRSAERQRIREQALADARENDPRLQALYRELGRANQEV